MVTRPCLVCGTPGTRGRCDNCDIRRELTAQGIKHDLREGGLQRHRPRPRAVHSDSSG